MLMARIFGLAAPALVRATAAATRRHHPDEESNENDPNPVAL